jgi:hypothetical protein
MSSNSYSSRHENVLHSFIYNDDHHACDTAQLETFLARQHYWKKNAATYLSDLIYRIDDTESLKRAIRLYHLFKKYLSNEEWIKLITYSLQHSENILSKLAQRGNHELLKIYILELIVLIENRDVPKELLSSAILRARYNHYDLFHLSIKSGDPVIFDLITSLLAYCIKNNVLSIDEFKHIMTNTTRLNFNILQTALNTKQIHIISSVLILIINSYQNRILSASDMQHFLLNVTQDGFTTLHDVIKINQPHLLEYFLTFCFYFCKTGVLEPSSYETLLTIDNKAGYTSLSKAMLTSNTYIFNTYILQLFNSILEGIVNFDVLPKLILKKNIFGFTSIMDAVKSNNAGILTTYFNILKLMVTNGYINHQQLLDLFFSTNQEGFNSFHQICNMLNTNLLNIYLKEMTQYISQKDIHIHFFLKTNFKRNIFLSLLNKSSEDFLKSIIQLINECMPDYAEQIFKLFLFPYQHIIKDRTSAQFVQDLKTKPHNIQPISLFAQS